MSTDVHEAGGATTLQARLRRDAPFVLPSVVVVYIAAKLMDSHMAVWFPAAVLLGWLVGAALEGREGLGMRDFVPARVAAPVTAGFFLVMTVAAKLLPIWGTSLVGAALIIGSGFLAAHYASRQ